MTYESAYDERQDTFIENIQSDVDLIRSDGDGLLEEIRFGSYGNPDVSVDSAARFAVHEIIGGMTVRQKLGEDPREIGVSGVCEEPVALEINKLHRANLCDLNSAVLDDIVRCQIASVSVDPLESGGAADMDGGEFLYSYQINLVEIDRPR